MKEREEEIQEKDANVFSSLGDGGCCVAFVLCYLASTGTTGSSIVLSSACICIAEPKPTGKHDRRWIDDAPLLPNIAPINPWVNGIATTESGLDDVSSPDPIKCVTFTTGPTDYRHRRRRSKRTNPTTTTNTSNNYPLYFGCTIIFVTTISTKLQSIKRTKRMSTPNQLGDETNDDEEKQPAAVDDATTTSHRKRSQPPPTAVDDETTTTVKKQKISKQHFVFVKIPIVDGTGGETKIEVKDGDDIDDIKTKIKEKCSPDFDRIPTYRMQLYASNIQKEPVILLDLDDTWNPGVPWGIKKQPLIVVVPTENGKCIVYLTQTAYLMNTRFHSLLI